MPSKKVESLYIVLPDYIREKVTQKEVEEYIISGTDMPFILKQFLESRVVGHTLVFGFITFRDKAEKYNCKTIEELDFL